MAIYPSITVHYCLTLPAEVTGESQAYLEGVFGSNIIRIIGVLGISGFPGE